MSDQSIGIIALVGSGETAPAGGQVFEHVARLLPRPPRVAILETPAGFEVNSSIVAKRVANYVAVRLQNYRPKVAVVPARKKGTEFSPDNPRVIEPLADANMLFLGPGSPTYAVRQLEASLAYHMLQARHRLGAALILASSAVLAFSAHTLPIYEIYKVGEDLHWHRGLNFFTHFGLSLVVVPHWNNAEGGAELDTSRCFMSQGRFDALRHLLPAGLPILGLDEHTAAVIHPDDREVRVMGRGHVTLLLADGERVFAAGDRFPVSLLGPFRLPQPGEGLPPEVWAAARARAEAGPSPVPDQVQALAEERREARARHDWDAADALREQIAELGWQVQDTAEGSRLEPS